mgnify:FL=1
MAENISPFLTRTALLLGQEAVQRLQDKTVVQVGLGGVGGSCAEALCRSGLGAMHLIDGDYVEPSNLNRQLFAAKSTLGLPKTEAARRRLEDVSDCRISVHFGRITPENVDSLLPPCDYIIDAIDDIPGKLALIEIARRRNVPILCCMGAGNRLDGGAFSVVDLFSTQGCRLARRMRQELRKRGITRLDVVFSPEKATRQEGQTTIGSLCPVTNAAGLTAANFILLQLLQS